MKNIEFQKEKLVRKMAIRFVYADARSKLDKAFNNRDNREIIAVNNAFNLFLNDVLDNEYVDQEILDLMSALSLMLHDKAIEYLKSI